MNILFVVLFLIVFNSITTAQEITVFGENQNVKEKLETKTCNCYNKSKCLELMSSMYHKRATLYNVLNLSYDQKEALKIIDQKRDEELTQVFCEYEQEKLILANMCKHNATNETIKKQEKIVNRHKKCLKQTTEKYDNELKKILNAEQKSKLNTIRKMEKKEIKFCLKNKAFYNKDKNLKPFGQKDFFEEETLCPTHKKWHIFGFKHKE